MVFQCNLVLLWNLLGISRCFHVSVGREARRFVEMGQGGMWGCCFRLVLLVGMNILLTTLQDYYITAAASFFDKHGFVVLEDVLPQPLLENLKNASTYIMERIFEEDPEGSFGGGAGKLPHRYSLGDPRLTRASFVYCFWCISIWQTDSAGKFLCFFRSVSHSWSFEQDASATKSNFHLDGYAAVIDLPTTSPLLREIFSSNDYFAAGCGGDVVLAGAMAACKAFISMMKIGIFLTVDSWCCSKLDGQNSRNHLKCTWDPVHSEGKLPINEQYQLKCQFQRALAASWFLLLLRNTNLCIQMQFGESWMAMWQIKNFRQRWQCLL